MVHVRHGFFRYRAFWMTAGLTAGAATWAAAIEPVGTPVLLQPVPASKVVLTQAQTAPAQPLRTQQAGSPQMAMTPQSGAPKSAVQLKLEELYQQDGRQMPDLPDPQIPRQAPGQGAPVAPLAPSPAAAAPGSSGLPARPISNAVPAQPVRSGSPAAQQGTQPQQAWTQAQAAGAPRSTPAKRPTPWIEQINPFKKKVSSAPPTEPAEIQYDPRHASGQFAQPQMQMAQQPGVHPGQVNPQASRQNYSQLFAQPQNYGTVAPQGDPFVASTPMAVAAAPRLTPANSGTTTPVPAAATQAFVPPVAAQTVPQTVVQSPAPFVPPAAVPPAAPATPPAGLPFLDFGQPAPVSASPAQPSAAPTQPSATPVLAAPAQPQAAQVAQLPLAVPQNPPGAVSPQSLVPTSTPPAAPPSLAGTPAQENASPFTGLGLNDAVPANGPPLVQSPPTVPAATPALPPLQVAAVPTPPAAAPATPATAAAPQSLPKLDGFFSAEEERQTDQPVAAKSPEQPMPLVVPTPPPTAGQPAFEVPKPAAMAPLVVVPPSVPDVPAPVDVATKAPVDLPKLELPPIAAAPQPLPATEVAQPESIPPLKPVPRQSDGAAASKMARIAARSDQRGLKGFCPVMLRDHRELVDAKPEFRSFYRNKIILLSSQEAKAVFESDPAKYAPAASGNDVIHLSQTGEELEGSLEHAVWYKGRLYMFQGAETLETFVAAPSSHATND